MSKCHLKLPEIFDLNYFQQAYLLDLKLEEIETEPLNLATEEDYYEFLRQRTFG